MKKFIAFLFVILVASACSTAKVTSVNVDPSSITHDVNTIAISPNGGIAGEAISIEISNLGYNVVDADATAQIFARANLSEFEISTPVGREKLKEKGIDAFLVVKAARSYDNQPENISARVTSTHTGKILAGVTWQNGYGGAPGSPADRTMRQGMVEAAQTIANELAKTLPR